jgi:hypothetical protein
MNPEVRSNEIPLTLEAVVFEIVQRIEREQEIAHDVEAAVSYLMFVDTIEKELGASA